MNPKDTKLLHLDVRTSRTPLTKNEFSLLDY